MNRHQRIFTYGAIASITLGLCVGLGLKPWGGYAMAGGSYQKYSDRSLVEPNYGPETQPIAYSWGSQVPEYVTGTGRLRDRAAQRELAAYQAELDRREAVYQARLEERYRPQPVSTYRPGSRRTYTRPDTKPHYPSMSGDILAVPPRSEPQTSPGRGAQRLKVGVADDQGGGQVDNIIERPDPGPFVREARAEPRNVDRSVEFDNANGAQRADVRYTSQPPARVQPIAQTSVDAGHIARPIPLSEHIERTIGGGAG